MNQVSAPCQNCKNRKFKCHSSCELYKNYVDEIKEKRKERHKEQKRLEDYFAAIEKTIY